jgi:hypothetical protein
MSTSVSAPTKPASAKEAYGSRPVQARLRRGGRLQASSQAGLSAWGYMPILAVVSAVALLIISVANYLARAGSPAAEGLFWTGICMMVGPFAARLASAAPSRQERQRLVVWLGLALYLVKLMNSPTGFTYADEFLHWYNVNTILGSQTLFSPNWILPVSALYPGLPSATAALVSLGGLSVFAAGILIIAAARLVLVLALFWLADQLSGSHRVAGLTVLIYAANPNFLFFDAQFAYESLALPLVVLVLAVAYFRQNSTSRHPVGLTLAALILISAVVISHHLSSYFMVGVLLTWSLLFAQFHLMALSGARVVLQWYAGEIASGAVWRSAARTIRNAASQLWSATAARQPSRDPSGLSLFALVLTLIWFGFVASTTASYLGIVLGHAVLAVIRLIAGEESGRALFESTTGYVAPIWEHVIGIGSIVILLAALPFGLRMVWRRYRRDALVLILTLMALIYFGSLGLRLAPAAWETSNRASEYLYIGLAFVLSLGLAEIWDLKSAPWLGAAIVTIGLTWVFCGGIVAGWPADLRLARTDQVAVGGRILEPEEMTTARWMLSAFGPGHVVAADDSNSRLLLTEGHQHALAALTYDLKNLLQAPNIGAYEIGTIQNNGLEYVLVDQRRISWNNMLGYFFVPKQPSAGWDITLFDPDQVNKFDRAGDVSRVLDSGNIVIYNVDAFRYGQPSP